MTYESLPQNKPVTPELNDNFVTQRLEFFAELADLVFDSLQQASEQAHKLQEVA